MKRDDLIELLQALPEDAEVQVADSEFGGLMDILDFQPANDNSDALFNVIGLWPENYYVLVTH